MKKELRNLDAHDLIGRMQTEIIDKGQEYTLPSKLQDHWLEFLLEKPMSPDHKSNQDNVVYSFILVILKSELKGHIGVMTEKELGSILMANSLDYFRELMCEYDYRRGNIYYDRATLETILNWRDIKVTQIKAQCRYSKEYEDLKSVHLEYSH